MSDKTLNNDETVEDKTSDDKTNDDKGGDDSKAIDNVKSILSEAGLDEEVTEKVINNVKTLEIQRGKTKDSLKKYEELGSFEELQKALKKDNEPDDKGKSTKDKPKSDDLDEFFEKKYQQKELENLSYPDEIKNEIKDWADFKGIPVKEAEKAPHISQKIEEWKDENDIQDASLSRTGNNNQGGKSKFDINNPPNVDMATKEGQEKWENWKKEAKKHFPNPNK